MQHNLEKYRITMLYTWNWYNIVTQFLKIMGEKKHDINYSIFLSCFFTDRYLCLSNCILCPICGLFDDLLTAMIFFPLHIFWYSFYFPLKIRLNVLQVSHEGIRGNMDFLNSSDHRDSQDREAFWKIHTHSQLLTTVLDPMWIEMSYMWCAAQKPQQLHSSTILIFLLS